MDLNAASVKGLWTNHFLPVTASSLQKYPRRRQLHLSAGHKKRNRAAGASVRLAV